MSIKLILPLVVVIYFTVISPAQAYIDPNTGGFFFQTVAPFVYGILGVIVVFWKRIAGFIKGLIGGKKDPENTTKDS